MSIAKTDKTRFHVEITNKPSAHHKTRQTKNRAVFASYVASMCSLFIFVGHLQNKYDQHQLKNQKNQSLFFE